MTIEPGPPFWAGFTAFAANMVALFGVDKLTIFSADIAVANWWAAVLVSLFVGAAVYGKEKVSEHRNELG